MHAVRQQLPRYRHFRFHPTTPIGLASVRLVATGALLTLSFSTLIAVSAHGKSFVLAPYLALAGVVAILVGGATALLAIVSRGERSIAVIATIPVRTLALIVFVGELLQLLVWLL